MSNANKSPIAESKTITKHHYTHPFTIPPQSATKPDLPPKPGCGIFIPKLTVAPIPGYANAKHSRAISETPILRLRNSCQLRKNSDGLINPNQKPNEIPKIPNSDKTDNNTKSNIENSNSKHIEINQEAKNNPNEPKQRETKIDSEPILKSQSLSERIAKHIDEDTDEDLYSVPARRRATYSQRLRSVDLTNNLPLEFPPVDSIKPPSFKARTYKYPSGNEIGTANFPEFHQTLEDLLRKYQGVTMKNNPASILLPK